MNRFSLRLVVRIIMIAFVTSAVVQDVAAREPLKEEAALKVLEQTLRHDRVYAERISLDCVSFLTEEKTAEYFGFVLRENHTAKCGGDPETSPVVDRYRVHRASGKIEWLEIVEDEWHPTIQPASGTGSSAISPEQSGRLLMWNPEGS